jgi:ketosteroid isomerase-like protein
MQSISLFVAMLAVMSPALAQTAEDAVRNAEKAWAAAARQADHAALARLLSEQLLYAHSTGLVENKTEYIEKVRTGARKYESIEHKNMVVKVFGDTAMVHATLRFLGANKETPFDHLVMLMHVWVKQDGRWQLAGHQATQLQE